MDLDDLLEEFKDDNKPAVNSGWGAPSTYQAKQPAASNKSSGSDVWSTNQQPSAPSYNNSSYNAPMQPSKQAIIP